MTNLPESKVGPVSGPTSNCSICRWAKLIIVATAVVLLYSAVERLRSPQSEWTVLADDCGIIKHVACVVNSARRASLRNAPLVTNIINALPKHTRITVLTNDPTAFAIAGNPQRGRLEFLDLPTKSDFTIWPQDPFVVLNSRKDRLLILASNEFDRVDDRLIPRRLAKHLGIAYRTSTLSFEGGNIVPGSRHVFIGANTIRYNAIKLKKSDTQIARLFQRDFGKPVLVLGPLPQPVAHIDMVITALDKKHVAVADPRWGARLASEELKKRPQSVKTFEKFCEDYFFGNPNIHELRSRSGKPIRPPKVIGRTLEAIKDSCTIAAQFDRISAELRRWGYRVSRVPFLYIATEAIAEKNTDKQKLVDPEPAYPCLTYNNVLIETQRNERTVYLPQYGWDTLDKTAERTWRKLGYRVVKVHGFAISAMYGGSLRCCAKVLRREH